MQLNRKLEGVQESATLSLNALAKSLAGSGRKISNLTAGELDFSTPEIVMKGVVKELKKNKYTDTLGLPELRKKIAGSFADLRLVPENIAVTAGAKHGLFAALSSILNPGDEVIVPVPAWVSYENQIILAGGKPVFVDLTEDFDLDVSGIRKKLSARTKAIIINSPHNPTGRIFSEKKLKELRALVKNKDIFVISDEIYKTLSFNKDINLPSGIWKSIKKLIIVDGFSKSHALTGWRIGYVAADVPVIRNMNKYLGHTAGNAAVLSQSAGLICLGEKGVTKEYLKSLKKRRKKMAEMLSQIPRINCYLPDGAFYFFADIRKITNDSQKFCADLLREEGVAVVPGEAFRAPGFIRLSFAAPEAVIEKGLLCLRRFIQKK